MSKPPSEFVQSLLELMEPVALVSWRRMFGGYGLYMDGVMMALVADDELYLKIDDQTREQFATAGSEPFVYEKNGKSMAMSYWRAPEAVFDDADEMLKWGRLALSAARRQRQ